MTAAVTAINKQCLLMESPSIAFNINHRHYDNKDQSGWTSGSLNGP